MTGKDNTSLGYDDYTGRPVYDTNLHWAYSLHGYEGFSIERDGVPIVPHVHGGHTDFQFDGNPEFFFSPGWEVRGPQWVEKKYVYLNDQPAGNLWYHDHALGITRLNVYTGMAGFYIIRDDFDTGLFGNPLSLPAYPYEAAFAIQDRMFKDDGALFLVDAVTSLGGMPVPVDELQIDTVYSGTQKCISGPPGLSPVTFGPAAIKVLEIIGISEKSFDDATFELELRDEGVPIVSAVDEPHLRWLRGRRR